MRPKYDFECPGSSSDTKLPDGQLRRLGDCRRHLFEHRAHDGLRRRRWRRGCGTIPTLYLPDTLRRSRSHLLFAHADLDVFTSGYGPSPPALNTGTTKLYINQGSDATGWYTQKTTGYSPAAGWIRQQAVGDFDGDGDMDAIVVGASNLQLLKNNGAATFSGTTVITAALTQQDSQGLNGYIEPIVAADFDGDSGVLHFLHAASSRDRPPDYLFPPPGSNLYPSLPAY